MEPDLYTITDQLDVAKAQLMEAVDLRDYQDASVHARMLTIYAQTAEGLVDVLYHIQMQHQEES